MRAGLDLSMQVSHQVGRDHFFLERGLDVLFLMFQVFGSRGDQAFQLPGDGF